MSLPERKAELIDVATKYKELKGWCKSLTSEEDARFLSSQGLSKWDILFIVWVFMPLMWAIKHSFNGVPYFMSFLKRRLKRVAPQERKEKIKKKKTEKDAKLLNKSTGCFRVKCCKNCEVIKKDKIVKEKLEDFKKSHVVWKSANTRKTFIRKLKRKLQREVSAEFDEAREFKRFEADGAAIDDILGLPPNEADKPLGAKPKLGEPLKRSRREKAEERARARREEVFSGKRRLPLHVIFERCFGFTRPDAIPPYLYKQFCFYLKPGPKGEMLNNGRDFFVVFAKKYSLLKLQFVSQYLLKHDMNWAPTVTRISNIQHEQRLKGASSSSSSVNPNRSDPRPSPSKIGRS